MKTKILFQLFRSKKQTYAVNINTISKQVNASGTANETESRESCIKWRYIAALLGFAIFNLLSMHRLNFNVSIVAMVNQSASKGQEDVASGSCLVSNVTDEDSTNTASEVRKGEFDWTPGIQGYILGSSFVGYFLTNFIGGKLAEIFGFKWISFCGVFLASLCTILTPFAAWFNVYALITAQTLRGMAQGVFQPCISILTANWFPKNERGSICAFILSGQGLGALIGGYVSGILCESSLFDGWPSAFYTFGIVGMILAILIAAFLYENPSVHPRISKQEMNYILSRQESSMSQKRPSTPWGSIFSSIPIYALTCAYFGQFWAATHFLAVHPLYLGTILHFPIQKNGLLSSVPFILLSSFGMLGSSISAFLTKKKYIGTSKQRKIFNTLSCLGYSGGVLGISLVECNKEWSIAFSFISLAFLGLGFSGCLVVPADMSPTFAGSLTGIACTVGSASAFILPLVVGFLTDGKQTIEQWQIFFYISIGITLSSAIIFVMFGSADIQPWNFVKEKNPLSYENDKEHKKENHIKLNRITA